MTQIIYILLMPILSQASMQFYTKTEDCVLSDLIIEQNQCETAAKDVWGLDFTVEVEQNEEQPYGCHVREDKLWLNLDEESEPEGDVSRLCGQKLSESSSTSAPVTLAPSPSATTNASDVYYLSETSICADGSELVIEEAECIASATALGLATVVDVIESEDVPYGCHFDAHLEQMYLNQDDEAEPPIDDPSRSMCKYIVPGVPTFAPTTFMPTTSAPSPSTTFQPTNASSVYYLADNATCLGGSDPVIEEAECVDASMALGLGDSVETYEHEAKPFGCHFEVTTASVMFNLDDEASAANDGDARSFCKWHAPTASPSVAPSSFMPTTMAPITMSPTLFSGNFYLSAGHDCLEGSELILEEEKCAQAAAGLGLLDTTVNVTENDVRPYGCYYRVGSIQGQLLWLNTDDETEVDPEDLSRRTLCEWTVPKSASPTTLPSAAPTISTQMPSASPTIATTQIPSGAPTSATTQLPSAAPSITLASAEPSAAPSITQSSAEPSAAPSTVSTTTHPPSASPSSIPTTAPINSKNLHSGSQGQFCLFSIIIFAIIFA